MGAAGGTGAISARVFDGLSTALADQTVTFTASAGSARRGHGPHGRQKGVARTDITGPEGATVTVVAAAGTVEQKTLIALQARPAAPPPTTPPVFPPPSPPPPPAIAGLRRDPRRVARLGERRRIVDADRDGPRHSSNAPAPTSYRWDCTGDAVPDVTTTVPTQTCLFPVAGSILTSVQVRRRRACPPWRRRR